MAVWFSVIISTMNRRDLVLEAIASVLQQRHPAHEIIVVIDGGSDDTANVVRRCHPNIIVIEQENRGLPAARNAGIAAATGNWLGFLDDDDLWHRDKLKISAEYLEQH